MKLKAVTKSGKIVGEINVKNKPAAPVKKRRIKDARLSAAIGNVLRIARVKKGIKQETLASTMKVTQSFISMIETRKGCKSIDTLERYCKALDISASVIMRAAEREILPEKGKRA